MHLPQPGLLRCAALPGDLHIRLVRLPAIADLAGAGYSVTSCDLCNLVISAPSRSRRTTLWVPESRSWVLSCEFVGEAMGPR